MSNAMLVITRNLYSNGFILSKRMQEYESQQAEIKRLETFVEKNITRASTSGMAKVDVRF